MAEAVKKSKVRTLTLKLDEEDYAHLVCAMRCRDEMGIMPEGGGNAFGRLIAEIARGWGGCVKCLQELGGPDEIPTRWGWSKEQAEGFEKDRLLPAGWPRAN